MRLTTKGRFAVTAMMDLALRGDDGPVALAGVSERQKISLSYLEQLFGKLRLRPSKGLAGFFDLVKFHAAHYAHCQIWRKEIIFNYANLGYCTYAKLA